MTLENLLKRINIKEPDARMLVKFVGLEDMRNVVGIDHAIIILLGDYLTRIHIPVQQIYGILAEFKLEITEYAKHRIENPPQYTPHVFTLEILDNALAWVTGAAEMYNIRKAVRVKPPKVMPFMSLCVSITALVDRVLMPMFRPKQT